MRICLSLPDAAPSLKSGSQIARVRSENWVGRNCYCPQCGAERLVQFAANSPAADFYCAICDAQFELKASKVSHGRKIVNGAYDSLIRRILADDAPSLLLMKYDAESWRVGHLEIIPSRFFVPSIIERRKPLAKSARRAGWVGSNICLHLIPKMGRIGIIRNGLPVPKSDVLKSWAETAFVSARAGADRNWLVDVMVCIEMLDKDFFSLEEVYAFEDRLKKLYPNNRNVRPKIRQQLQILRDQGKLEFQGRGKYRKVQDALS